MKGGETHPSTLRLGEPTVAYITRFKAFSDSDGCFDGIDNLDASITVNSHAENPKFRFKGGDADATDWDYWTYGANLVIDGSGTDPSFNQGSPLLGSNDDSVKFNAGKTFEGTNACFGLGADDDMLIEMVLKSTDNTGTQYFLRWLGTYDMKLSWVGYELRFNIGTGGAGTCISEVLEPDTWYHVMIYFNRDEASANGVTFFINGVESGDGKDMSGADATALPGGSFKFNIGGSAAETFRSKGSLAYVASWSYADWFQAGATGKNEVAAIAKERFAKLIGVYPSTASGTAVPLTMTRASHAYIDKYEVRDSVGMRRLYRVGDNWIRACKRPISGTSPTTYEKGIVLEQSMQNYCPNSNSFTGGDWTFTSGTCALSSQEGPLGPGTVYKITSTTTNLVSGFSGKSKYFTLPGTDDSNYTSGKAHYVNSMFFKVPTHSADSDKANWVKLYSPNGGFWGLFDLDKTKVVGWGSSTDDGSKVVGIENWGDGWRRVYCGQSLNGIDTTAGSVYFLCYQFPNPNETSVTVPGYVTVNVETTSFICDTTNPVIYFCGACCSRTHMSTYFDTGSGGADNSGAAMAAEELTYKASDGNIDGGTGVGGAGKLACQITCPYPTDWSAFRYSDAEYDAMQTILGGGPQGKEEVFTSPFKSWDAEDYPYNPHVWLTATQIAWHITNDEETYHVMASFDGFDSSMINATCRFIETGDPASITMFTGADHPYNAGKKSLSVTWGPSLTGIIYGQAPHVSTANNIDSNTQMDSVWIGKGSDKFTNQNDGGLMYHMISDLTISNEEVQNDITISNLGTDTVVYDGFNATIDYVGDDDEDAGVSFYYCNHTDNPDCDPVATGVSGVMTRDDPSDGEYGITIEGLSYDPGDVLNLEVVATDPDGVTGSPLTGTVTLPITPITISNIASSGVNSEAFDIRVDYTGDVNSDAELTMWYCNHSNNPGCQPTVDGDSTTMDRDDPVAGNFGTSVSGLLDPGDTYNVVVTAVDPDGVTGSPQSTTVTLDNRNDTVFSNLRFSDPTSTSFDTLVDFTYDQNDDATAVLYWCNETDNPGCDPYDDNVSSGLMNRVQDTGLDSGEFTFGVSGLSDPQDPGDTINVRVIGYDDDGVTGSPLNGQITLSSDALVLEDCTVSNIDSDGFDVVVTYTADNDEDSVGTLYYCNRTLDPDCDPDVDGTGVTMTKDTVAKTFSYSMTGLPRNNPGYTYALTVLGTDADGVFGSPLESCGTVTLADGADIIYIPGDNTVSTALDADEISGFDMGAFFCNMERLHSFQIGNISTALSVRYRVIATGLNSEIVDDVYFSLDRETWSSTLNLPLLLPNTVSPTIWVKYAPPEGSVIGEGTFKITVESI